VVKHKSAAKFENFVRGKLGSDTNIIQIQIQQVLFKYIMDLTGMQQTNDLDDSERTIKRSLDQDR
jgi:hypothetical protein